MLLPRALSPSTRASDGGTTVPSVGASVSIAGNIGADHGSRMAKSVGSIVDGVSEKSVIVGGSSSTTNSGDDVRSTTAAGTRVSPANGFEGGGGVTEIGLGVV